MVIVIIALILAIAIIPGIIVALMVWKRKRDGKSTERSYRAFYIMGVICVPLSVALMVLYFIMQIPFFVGIPFLALGLTYLMIGLVNRYKRQ